MIYALPCGRCKNCLVSCFWIKLELALHGLTADFPGFPNRAATDLLTSLFHMHHIPFHPISPGTSLPELHLTNLLLCQPGDSPSPSSSPHLLGLLYLNFLYPQAPLEDLHEKLPDTKSMKGKTFKAFHFSRFYSQWQKKNKLCKEAVWKPTLTEALVLRCEKGGIFVSSLPWCYSYCFLKQPALYKVTYAFT